MGMLRLRLITIALLTTVFCFQGNAQIDPCSTPDRIYGTTPSPAELKLKQEIDQRISALADQKSGHELLIIPVVVHVIHMGAIGNISDEQVIDGIRVLNEDFNRLNADSVNTNPYFQPFAADVNIEFRLATLDPSGNPTTGIVRVDTNIIPHPEPTDPDFDNIKYVSHWPEDMYFNIWTTRAIQGGSLGYAQYPGTAFTYGGPWHTWGPIVKSNQWGTIGTSSVDGRTATHEVGHCFGLYHTFLSSAAGCGAECDTTGDEVCDTPPCLLDWSCAVSSSCANDAMGPSPFPVDSSDQMENYMSYNSCQNMFSEGQKYRMRGYYFQFDTIYNLSLTSNLIATGTLFALNLTSIEAYDSEISLYPNPGNGLFTLHLPASSDRHYCVFDAMGKMVMCDRPTTSESSIDLHSFDRGLYHLRISIDGYSFHRKIILQ